ncbi:MAG: ATP-binding protein [bacterium]|nr:ATP-binding protein [bacterium]
MFGKILRIKDNFIYLENRMQVAETNLIGYNVIFKDASKDIVGEIQNISITEIEILLLGQIKDGRYLAGILKKPNADATARIITKRELEYLLGSQDYSNKNNLLVGNSLVYDTFKVTADKNKFFSGHFAILGNTGSGKSCAAARLLQNLFYSNDDALPLNSHFVIFDVFGEYKSAFKGIERINGLGFKSYSTKPKEGDNQVKIPAYFLGVDDLALLLDVNDYNIIPVLENTLRLTYIFNSTDPETVQYKDFIIASTLMDILACGKPAAAIRDQIIAALTKYNTVNINLDSILHQPGYDRTLRQCLLIDNQGKMNAIGLVTDFVKQFLNFDLNDLKIKPNFVYTLDNLKKALDFSLLNEGILNSSKQYDKLNTLKIRLNSIINSEYKKIFEFDRIVSKEEYIKAFFSTNAGTPAQIVNINLNGVDDRMIKRLSKIYAKLFFDYVTNLEKRASFPIHIVIEEAHRYVQNDHDYEVIGYNIFDRITKEGRKYGIILGLITQRPSELSPTSLSQCTNFLILRLHHPDDIDIVSKISAAVNKNTLEKIKTLRSGMPLCFGTAFNIPVIVDMDLPNPMPSSTSVDIVNEWYK